MFVFSSSLLFLLTSRLRTQFACPVSQSIWNFFAILAAMFVIYLGTTIAQSTDVACIQFPRSSHDIHRVWDAV